MKAWSERPSSAIGSIQRVAIGSRGPTARSKIAGPTSPSAASISSDQPPTRKAWGRMCSSTMPPMVTTTKPSTTPSTQRCFRASITRTGPRPRASKLVNTQAMTGLS